MAQVTPKARTGEGLKDLLDYPDHTQSQPKRTVRELFPIGYTSYGFLCRSHKAFYWLIIKNRREK